MLLYPMSAINFSIEALYFLFTMHLLCLLINLHGELLRNTCNQFFPATQIQRIRSKYRGGEEPMF